MTGSAEALTAYQLICTLAEENAGVLDVPARLMAQNAWIGGGAQGFADDLAARHRGMQQAWADALEEAASLVARTGGGCFIPPQVGTPVNMARVAGPEVGAQLGELTSLTGQVGRAGGALSEAGVVLAGALAVAGLPAGPATTVQATGEWATQAAGTLRRRLALFEQADHAGGTLTARQAGFGVFASWLPGESSLGALLDQATSGDKAALAALLQRQGTATTSDLAIAVNTWWGA